ncbi:hemicentin-1-like isoform X1 [Oculina patagonica]
MAASSLECIRALLACSLVSCAFLVLTAPGAGALKFLNPPAIVLQGFLGLNIDINCTTDNPNATVSLLHTKNFVTWTERTVEPNKLILNGQVFTLLYLVVGDGGRYNCKATAGSQTIRWPMSSGYMILQSGALPKHFQLVPNIALILLRGGDGQILCEAQGTTVSKLQWKKITASGEENVPDSKVTNAVDTTKNLVKAILKITNAQTQDAGEYKCVLTAYSKTDHRLISIRVDGKFVPPKSDVHWYRNGRKLDVTKCTGPDDKSCEKIIYEVYEVNVKPALHTTFTEQVLKIRSAVYPRDHGKFECIATNGVDPSAKLAFDLDVQAAPVLNKRSDTVLAIDGAGAEVSCLVDKSNPLPTFTWQYQNLDCPDADSCLPDENQWKSVPGNLMITPTNTPTNKSVVQVEKDQLASFYRCKAVNTVGNDAFVIKLVRLAKAKKLTEFDANSKTQFNEESTLRLVCFDRCGIFCPVAHFTKGGEKLSHENDARVNVTISQSPTSAENRLVLTVKNLTLNDSESYRCVSSAKPDKYDEVNVTIHSIGSVNPCHGSSCYFISTAEEGRSWNNNRNTCQDKGGDLVSIETLAEWQFINGEIQKKYIGVPNEWHIGLHKVGGVWKWINNSPFSLASKWQSSHGEPSGDGDVAVISKDYPPTHQGEFNDLARTRKRAFICELSTATGGDTGGSPGR